MSPEPRAQSPEPLLQIDGLEKHFPIRRGLLRRVVGHVRAVDGVSFTLHRGETLGLVGESGCGKTTVGRCLLRLIEPTAGRVRLSPAKDDQPRRHEGHEGEHEGATEVRDVSSFAPSSCPSCLQGSSVNSIDLVGLNERALRRLRPRMQIVFQDPHASLNPRMTVGDIVAEPLTVNRVCRGDELTARVTELLQAVGLRSNDMRRYPHAFSGGQRQRIGIARALALRPELVVADEPVSALDVSVQAQILNLLADLREQFQLSYLFIAHDLSVVEHISDRVAVMYLGRIVEIADTETLYRTPRHPYSEALLSAVPVADPRAQRRRQRIRLEGDVPSPAAPPSGCSFHPRCRYAQPICSQTRPELEEIAPGVHVACHRARELSLVGV